MKKLNYCTDFELSALPPYNFELTVHKPLGYYWLNPTDFFFDGMLWTTISLSSGKIVGLRLKSIGSIELPRILVTMFSEEKLSAEEEREVLENLTRCAELKVDITQFYSVAEQDPILRQVKRDLYGMRCGGSQLLFHDLILAITLQNAPVKRTDQMLELLFSTYGRTVAFDGHTITAWFTPERIAMAGIEELRQKCKLGFRARYVKAVAGSILNGECPTLEELEKMPFKEAKAELMRLKGIGEYSAEIALPHTERFPIDIWSAKIFWRLFYPKESIPTIQTAIQGVRKHAEDRWKKWRGYAFIYVINDLENLSKKFKIKLS